MEKARTLADAVVGASCGVYLVQGGRGIVVVAVLAAWFRGLLR